MKTKPTNCSIYTALFCASAAFGWFAVPTAARADDDGLGTDRVGAMGVDDEKQKPLPPGARVEDGKAYAQNQRREAPASGAGLVIAGGVLMGIGLANLATSPLCELHAIDESARGACLGTALAFGGVLTAVGIPLVVVGARQRHEFEEWRHHHSASAGFQIAPGKAYFSIQAAF